MKEADAVRLLEPLVGEDEARRQWRICHGDLRPGSREPWPQLHVGVGEVLRAWIGQHHGGRRHWRGRSRLRLCRLPVPMRL